MAITVTMPQLGESVTEGTVARWLKQPGEAVARYEPVAEVITDKVNAEIPAPADGVMGEQLVAEGTVVPVGGELCRLLEAGAAEGGAASAEAAAPRPAAAAGPAAEPAGGGPEPAPQPPGVPDANGSAGARPPQTAAPQRAARAVGSPEVTAAAPAASAAALHVSPAVRMLAREHGIDLGQLSGSGIGGRITKKDVLEFVQRRDSAPPAAPVVDAAAEPAPRPAQPAPQPAPTTRAEPASAPAGGPLAVPGADTLVPLTPMRRAIADHMVRSRQTSPDAWLMVEVDMTAAVGLRAARRAEFRQRTGLELTFLPIVARIVVDALRAHPTLNATWSEEGVVLRRELNLGIAVALEDGLIVPVVRNADRLNVAGLAAAFADLIDRARTGRLRMDDVQGGTFTLNNAGALGTVASQAIINQPQAAILVTDAIVKRPVVVEGDAIAVRSMMNLSLSFDHRINDGLQGARFLRSVKQGLEAVDEGAALL